MYIYYVLVDHEMLRRYIYFVYICMKKVGPANFWSMKKHVNAICVV